jgi:hypothetical protein
MALLGALLAVVALGAGFVPPHSVASEPIPCEGDACQPLPSPPVDPVVTTSLEGVGNPPVHYERLCRKGFVKRHDRCIKVKRKKRGRHGRNGSVR